MHGFEPHPLLQRLLEVYKVKRALFRYEEQKALLAEKQRELDEASAQLECEAARLEPLQEQERVLRKGQAACERALEQATTKLSATEESLRQQRTQVQVVEERLDGVSLDFEHMAVARQKNQQVDLSPWLPDRPIADSSGRMRRRFNPLSGSWTSWRLR